MGELVGEGRRSKERKLREGERGEGERGEPGNLTCRGHTVSKDV